jgi:predicted nucleic acid-binding protein
MPTFLDTTAVMAAHVEGPARLVALDAIAADPFCCASALALTESLALVDRLTDEPILRADLEDAIRLLWDRLYVVPIDTVCLDRAASLMREQPLRVAQAIQLAAADRLPRPVRYVTFDSAHIPVALSLGFEVVSL